MSSYQMWTKHPRTGEWEMADWIDDFYAPHQYGVRFPDGTMWNPERTKLEVSHEVGKPKSSGRGI